MKGQTDVFKVIYLPHVKTDMINCKHKLKKHFLYFLSLPFYVFSQWQEFLWQDFPKCTNLLNGKKTEKVTNSLSITQFFRPWR